MINLQHYICDLKTEENIESKTSDKKPYRWLRRLLRVLLGILIFLFLVVLFVRSPWGQNIIVNRVVNYVENKTNTKVEIEKLFITFDGDVQLDGLYLEDKKGDTLVYSNTLEANIPLWAMIKGQAVGVEDLDWDGLRANIIRNDSISGYNFQFLIDAFTPADTATVATDTTAAPLNVIIGNLNLKNFDVVFDDKVAGIDSRFKVGQLKAEMENTNIEQMIFDAADFELTDANIKFIQNPVSFDTTTSNVPLPKFSAESLTLKNVIAYYQSLPDQIIADLNIDDFYAEIPKFDLSDTDINFNEIRLENSKILIRTETEDNGITQKAEELKDEAKKDIQLFEWPQIKVNITEIDLKNNDITYRVANNKPQQNVFNPNAIALQQLNLKANNIKLKDQLAALQLETLTFNEISGLNLKTFQMNFKASDTEMNLDNLQLQLNNNSLSGYVELNYNSLSSLLEKPENTKVNLNLPSYKISLSEIFKFQPELKNNEYLQTLSKKQFTGNINASGTLASINFPNLKVNWGNSTHISANGTIQNPTNPDLLAFDIPDFSVDSKRKDLMPFIPQDSLSINLPEDVKLTGDLKGSLQNIDAKAKLTTSQGIVTVNGNFKNTDTIAFDTQLTVNDYQVNELLNNPQFGTLSLTVDAKGKGTDINNLDATLDAKISSFQLNDYAIKDINIQGNIDGGTGKVVSNYKDDNLNIKLDALVVLDSVAPEVTAELDVIGADLQALGFMQRNVKTGMTIYADFKGNTESYTAAAIVEDGVVIYDNKTYLLGSLEALANVKKDTSSISVSNKMVDLLLQSNADPQTFSKAIQRHIFSYFYRDEKVPDSITNPVNLILEGKISQSPLLNDVFLVNVKDLDTIDISVDFNEKARKLKANITAPHINYSGNELDSLAFSMNTDKENFNFNLGFKNITAGPLDIPKTMITGNQYNNELSLNFLGYHDGERLMNVNTRITGSRERLVLKVNPDSLVLNKSKWVIPETNEMVLTENKVTFNEFIISKDNQSIEITDKLPSVNRDHVALDFKNFKINEVFNYLNPESKIAVGNLNGDFILEEPFRETGILADLSIDQLKILNTDLGTLSLNGNSLGGNNYAFNIGLKKGLVDLDLVGDYMARSNDAELDLELRINKFQMEALNTLSLGEVKNGSGNFTGNFTVTGSTTDPQYQGSLNFIDAKFNIARLNTPFTLVNETLNVQNEGLSMSNFTILDENNNKMIVSGDVGTDNFLNPTFDLNLKATNFQVLDATVEDNEDFYGKATFNADAKLTGDLQIPKVDASLTLGSETDVVYVMPSAVVNVEERDGIVVFVNRENPDAILTQTEEQTATIKGFDIKALLKAGKDASVTIIIDEETGDNFKVKGEGEFNFTMKPNGRLTLSGVYEISDGHYELNLYNLVNRRFELAPGSRVTWSGDPFDAKLDVRAIYKLETSASSLMAAETAGADPSVRNKYRQVLPFFVYLNIEGELLQPEISFQLDMPEDEQGSVGGQVYGRVQQVNNQESELNRQVFSLLVLNRFYPDPGSDGSAGGFASIAQDNLNDAVADQLNTFSDKIFGRTGVEFDFGLDSYTDYQGEAAQDRTQLDIAAQKKLFNDRLTVRVGSEVDIQGSSSTGEATPLIGNVSLEYTLTEDGRYRLKGFRRNEFENVIDGQTVVSGIALIFTQEFNKFSELWDAILRSQSEKREAEKEAAEKKLKEKQEEVDESIEKKKN
ncbi:translocation/assembly module TamB domain-containing protein [Winogradskyella ursingii]|uniref:translocation/assembly module TamB domain-containing protein n=1 Tax=Winogradskyella ursingii TaxID=2686079 RepID=UPI0015C91AB1|nr:translocation/assembly module TamB domain-containing protein [Winogradskyella ursingii]